MKLIIAWTWQEKLELRSNNLDTEIHLSNEEELFVDSLKEKFKEGKKFLIGVHTTSGNSSPNWKPSKYRELILKLKSISDVQILVTDIQIPQEVKNIDGVLYPPKKTLRELIHIISTLDLLISSSTGPAHVAAALKIPTITMFCPLPACSPDLWGPKGNKATNILPDKNYCGKVCSGNPKQCYFEGEGGISVDRVFKEVQAAINFR